MVDPGTAHLTKPATQYEQSLQSAAHHKQMAEGYRKDAEMAERSLLPETKQYWRQHCEKQAAKHDEDAIWWAERAERFK